MLLVASLMLATAASAQVVHEVAPQAELALRLEVSRTEYALYEPVTVITSVQNPTSEAIEAYLVLDPTCGYIRFFIMGPDGTTREYENRVSRLIAHRRTVLEPGSQVVSEADLNWGIAGSAFPAAGEYEIYARLLVGREPKIHIESNRVSLKVEPPVGVNREAIDFFASEDLFRQLMRDGVVSYCHERNGPGCSEEIRQFIANYGTSAYTPVVMGYLANAVEGGRLEVPPNFESASALYREFLERWPEHQYAPRVLYALARTRDRSVRISVPAKTILAFERLYPEQTEMIRWIRSNLEAGKRLGLRQ